MSGNVKIQNHRRKSMTVTTNIFKKNLTCTYKSNVPSSVMIATYDVAANFQKHADGDGEMISAQDSSIIDKTTKN